MAGVAALGEAAPRRAGAVVQGLFAAAGARGRGPLGQRLARGWRRPSAAADLTAALVLCADHDLNVSAFTARCVASADAPLESALLAALCALRGRRHGGMAERVAGLLAEAGRDGAREAVARALREQGALPGFGHELYPAGDPRGAELLRRAGAASDDPPVAAVVDARPARARARARRSTWAWSRSPAPTASRRPRRSASSPSGARRAGRRTPWRRPPTRVSSGRARATRGRGRPAPWDDPGMADGRVRIDKWLWAARFFKTRSLATEAVQGGRVQVDGIRVKPARDVRVGEIVAVTVGETTTTVVVRALADKRGSAPQAALLYEETDESRRVRERRRELRRMAPPPGADLPGRPSKRDRRRIEAMRGRQRGGRRSA